MYRKYVGRSHPAAMIVLVDQSEHMAMEMPCGPIHQTKATVAQRLCNSLIYELVIGCSRGKTVKDECFLSVIGYGHQQEAQSLLKGFHQSMSEICDNTIRVETRVRQSMDGPEKYRYPVWLDAFVSDGTSSMGSGFQLGKSLLSDWLATHQDCFPPIAVNISGRPIDENTVSAAEDLKSLQSSDGHLLLFSIYLSEVSDNAIRFPEHESLLPNEDCKRIFRMTSELVDWMAPRAPDSYTKGALPSGARGLVVNSSFPIRICLNNTSEPASRQYDIAQFEAEHERDKERMKEEAGKQEPLERPWWEISAD